MGGSLSDADLRGHPHAADEEGLLYQQHERSAVVRKRAAPPTTWRCSGIGVLTAVLASACMGVLVGLLLDSEHAARALGTQRALPHLAQPPQQCEPSCDAQQQRIEQLTAENAGLQQQQGGAGVQCGDAEAKQQQQQQLAKQVEQLKAEKKVAEDKAAVAAAASSAFSVEGGPMQPWVDKHWDFKLPMEGRRRGTQQRGDLSRLRAALLRAASGDPLRVFFAGGSVTRGVGSTLTAPPFPARFGAYLNATYPPTKGRSHTVVNGGVGGTTSMMYDMCAGSLLPPDFNIYVLEFTANDVPPQHACERGGERAGKDMWLHPHRLAYERLVRRILALPHKPAVILMHHTTYFGTLTVQSAAGLPRFYWSAENDYNVVAEYYDIPAISYRQAVWPYVLAATPGYLVQTGASCNHTTGKTAMPFCVRTREALAKAGIDPEKDINYEHQLQSDVAHPYGGTGHRYMAELLIHMTQLALHDRTGLPSSANPADPYPPMIPGNEVSRPVCCTMHALRPLATRMQGFEWVDDGGPDNPKPGWAGNTTGSWVELDLKLDEKSEGLAKPGEPIELLVALVHSWKDVGQARIECKGGGCQCKAVDANLHWKQSTTQPSIVSVPATMAPTCTVRVSVQPETTTEGHRVKLAAVILNLQSGTSFDYSAAAGFGAALG